MKNFLVLLFCLNVFLCKAQIEIVKQWDLTLGGTGSDNVYGTVLTCDGGFLVYGTSRSPIGGSKTSVIGDGDYWIVKIDAQGNKLWDKSYGGNFDDALSTAIATNDCGFLLVGSVGGGANGDISHPSRGGRDAWAIKIDSNGNKLWDGRYGGPNMDIPMTMLQTPDGGYIIGSYCESSAGGDKSQTSFGPGNSDYWVIKIDSSGNKQWDKAFGGSGQDELYSIALSMEGGYILGGYTASGISGNKTIPLFGTAGKSDYWVIKIDSVGDMVWEKNYGTESSDRFKRVVSSGSGYLVAGESSQEITGNKTSPKGPFWAVRVDSSGTIIWDRGFNTPSELRDLISSSDGGFLLSGTAYQGNQGDKTEENLGEAQGWILKIDSNGSKLWDKTILSLGHDDLRGVFEVNNGCYVISILSEAGIGGYKTQPSFGDADYWILKLCEQPVGIKEITDKIQIQVYPNPTADDISISIQQTNLQSATFTLTNALGQVIYHREEANIADSYTKSLDLRNLLGGSYFVTVEVDGEKIVKQVVKR